MQFLVGVFVVFGCVLLGYVMHHGNIPALWQPNELVIICGAALGSFIISNPLDVIKGVGTKLKLLLKSKPYHKKDYLDLICFCFLMFKLMKSKGLIAAEPHIENPHESDIFQRFPNLLKDHHAVDFFCDYIRMMTMGVDNASQLEDLIEAELELHHHEDSMPAAAIGSVAEAMPALGIVAAVLGVITTMRSISEPPAILGGLIAAALVGTFLGVLLSYGIITPISSYISKYGDAEDKYLRCIKAGLVAYAQGNAPTIITEYMRKVIPHHERPSFKDTEDTMNKLSG